MQINLVNNVSSSTVTFSHFQSWSNPGIFLLEVACPQGVQMRIQVETVEEQRQWLLAIQSVIDDCCAEDAGSLL